MNKNYQGQPDPGKGKRRQIDRTYLEKALAEQEARDAQTPPANLTTKMGAVRLLGNLILDRRRRGWTDAMLVAHLRALGLEISAETLCVYRARLKEERGGDIADVPPAVAPPPPPSPLRRPEPASGTSNATPQKTADTVPTRSKASPSPAATDPEQPTFDRSKPFDDRV